LTGLDFNPIGELMAAINFYGICLISNIDSNGYKFDIPTPPGSSNDAALFTIIENHEVKIVSDGALMQMKVSYSSGME
jgi:hypothetical protein